MGPINTINITYLLFIQRSKDWHFASCMSANNINSPDPQPRCSLITSEENKSLCNDLFSNMSCMLASFEHQYDEVERIAYESAIVEAISQETLFCRPFLGLASMNQKARSTVKAPRQVTFRNSQFAAAIPGDGVVEQVFTSGISSFL